LSEHKRLPNSRAYRMRARAEQVEQTRQRIIHAAVHLHETLGPAATTIAAIAEQAGVTRLTVYRHFPDWEALYQACSSHWMSQHIPPDPDAWASIADPAQRLRAGLTDLYRYYRQGAVMLTQVYRDKPAIEQQLQRVIDSGEGRYRDVLLAPFTAHRAQRRRLCAVLGHAVSFWTWRSLCIQHGLTDRDAVDAMATLALTIATDTPTAHAPAPSHAAKLV
jgi:AcrR family transcriptional regulator